MKTWAEKEVEIACKKENPNRKEGEFDYGCACYESALKAYRSLCEDGHSGTSILFTKNILNRLIEGKTLTPIEDADDCWVLAYETKDDILVYQCKRMGSLFKYVHPNKRIQYRDVNRFVGVDINDPSGATYHNGLIDEIMDSLYPISMPYYPENDPFMVYCESFLTDRANGDYDTVRILYAIEPGNNGGRQEIQRCFKEEDGNFIEIDETEYEFRKMVAYFL